MAGLRASRTVLAALALSLAAFPGNPGALEAAEVGTVRIVGARTRPEVLRFFVDTREGEQFDHRLLARDVQRLKNTGLFYDIRSEVVEADGLRHVTFHLKNKFSTIPIFKYKQGGGTTLLTAGVYDVNILDRMLEAGIQYERMSGRDGLAAWIRHPYFLSNRNRLGSEAYLHTFRLPLLTINGEEQAHFDNDERRWKIFLDRELSEDIVLGIAFNVYDNTFTPDNSTAEKEERNEAFNLEQRLEDGLTVSLSPRVAFGSIDTERFYSRGIRLDVEGELADDAIGSDFTFAKGIITLTAGFRPLERLNIATRFMLGSTTGNTFQHKFYLGGLESLRGFFDGQFRGEHMWVANTEIRTTLADRTRWAVQSNLFMDLGKTWDDTSFGLDGFESPFVSYGIGFRLILPRIYRAVLRIDLARTEEPVEGYGFNIGVQQFF